MSGKELFDEYGLKAQLMPGLFSVLPLGLTVYALTGGNTVLLGLMWPILITAGGTFLLGMITRTRGRRLQTKLWEKWGGAPSTQLLRHCGTANAIQRRRWHQALEQLTDTTFPTEEDERENPDRADAIYEAAVRDLINARQDRSTFRSIHRENIHYGFSRTLLSMRVIGVFLALVGAAACSYLAWENRFVDKMTVAMACANGILAAVWIGFVTESMVRANGEAYARALLESSTQSTHRLSENDPDRAGRSE